jgi:hypothetical protein
MATTNFNWTCQYCNHPQIVTDSNWYSSRDKIRNPPGEFGPVAYTLHSITCQNRKCGRMALGIALHHRKDYAANDYYEDGTLVQHWSLLPESSAKPQPDYIPEVIRNDYNEACRIRDLSPKASATLLRRCLQGMVRDFAKIAKARLIDEIRALETALEKGTCPPGVTPESVEAIDKVRQIGNIGAHMEKDVDLIVDIEPGEAQVLIELIEMVFDEWYVARHVRQERLARVSTVSAQKKLALEQARLAKAEDRDLPRQKIVNEIATPPIV